MPKGFQGAVLRMLGAKEHRLTVVGREQIAPHYVRIRFHSPTIVHSEGEAPGAWLRLWFPDPSGSSKEYQRGYTIAQCNGESGELDLEFVLHEPRGPASTWASTCDSGDELVAMRYGDRPFVLPEPAPRGLLLLGDLAALPAIRALAAEFSSRVPVIVRMEEHDPRDRRIPLPTGQGIDSAWVAEKPGGQALAEEIRGGDFKGWAAWVTAESVATRLAKQALNRECGLPKTHLHAQAYWIRSRAMGKERAMS